MKTTVFKNPPPLFSGFAVPLIQNHFIIPLISLIPSEQTSLSLFYQPLWCDVMEWNGMRHSRLYVCLSSLSTNSWKQLSINAILFPANHYCTFILNAVCILLLLYNFCFHLILLNVIILWNPQSWIKLNYSKLTKYGIIQNNIVYSLQRLWIVRGRTTLPLRSSWCVLARIEY